MQKICAFPLVTNQFKIASNVQRKKYKVHLCSYRITLQRQFSLLSLWQALRRHKNTYFYVENQYLAAMAGHILSNDFEREI